MSAPIVEICLEGPAKNALGSTLMRHLDQALDEAAGRPVLLTGSGDAFSAGLDLREISGLDAEGMRQFLLLLDRVVDRLFTYPGPTVAAVNGHAIAGGAILAIVADHRVGTTDPRARIGLNEVALGLRFPPGILEVLRYRVSRLEAAVLGAALVPPATALGMGMLDELADDPVAVARERLAALAAHPADAYAHAKAALRGRVRSRDPEAERAFLDEILPTWTSSSLKDTIRAFLERPKR